MKTSPLTSQLLIVLIGIVLFIPFLGSVHLFDWDEINFAECAREMLVTGNYNAVTINFQPFWEKPPLFIWMQALSMHLFGVNEFAARFPNAVCGILTLLVFFNIGSKLYDTKFAWIWVLVYVGSFLPHFYFKSGIIDPWFNLFIFSSINYFIEYKNTESLRFLLFSAILIGLGMLTKGPVALLLFGMCVGVYGLITGVTAVISIKDFFLYAFTALFVGSLWFMMLFLTGNGDVIIEFFEYQVRLFNTQDSGHGGPFLYHWIVLLLGCFPLSVFALRAFTKNVSDTTEQKYFKLWMLILFWVVLLLFSIVKTKIVHYSSMCYFPLSFLAAYTVYKLLKGEMKWHKSTSVFLYIIGSILGVLFMLLPFVDSNKDVIIASGIIKDDFAVENLKANVYWSGYEWIIGFLFFGGVIIMLRMIKRNKIQQGIIGLFLISLLVVNLASSVIAGRIEQYSQGAAIEFYESLQGEDCYVETIGFKSYGDLFYSHKQKPDNEDSFNLDWLLSGAIDKPAYFVTKITKVEDINRWYPLLKEMYRKNGFVFLKRDVGE